MDVNLKRGFSSICVTILFVHTCVFVGVASRDEERIQKACYWPHEVFESCFGGCAEITCDNPVSRQRPCYPYCEPGCVCKEPYVRDDRTHTCVMPDDCSVTQMGIPAKSAREEMTRRRADVLSQGLAPNEVAKHGQTDYARLGNYFNIVIAPPPIRPFESRKMKGHDKRKALDDSVGNRKDDAEFI